MLPAGMTLAVSGFANSGAYLQFLPSGLMGSVTGGSPTSAGTFTLCVSGFKGRTINFNVIGRVNITAMTTNCP